MQNEIVSQAFVNQLIGVTDIGGMTGRTRISIQRDITCLGKKGWRKEEDRLSCSDIQMLRTGRPLEYFV